LAGEKALELPQQGKAITGQVGSDQMQHRLSILAGLTPGPGWHNSPKRHQNRSSDDLAPGESSYRERN
jgi:hypothetical protein